MSVLFITTALRCAVNVKEYKIQAVKAQWYIKSFQN